jgi:hypothetical protein
MVWLMLRAAPRMVLARRISLLFPVISLFRVGQAAMNIHKLL